MKVELILSKKKLIARDHRLREGGYLLHCPKCSGNVPCGPLVAGAQKKLPSSYVSLNVYQTSRPARLGPVGSGAIEGERRARVYENEG